MKLTLIVFLIGLIFLACSSPGKKDRISDDQMAIRLSDALNKGILDVWYPRTIDSIYGGFLSDFDYQWEMKGAQNKMIVTQSRHVWTCSTVAESDPKKKDYFLKIASHGFQFLKTKMWDSENGGFFNLVDREGKVLKSGQTGRVIKEAYGNAFGIYALATYARVSNDTSTL